MMIALRDGATNTSAVVIPTPAPGRDVFCYENE